MKARLLLSGVLLLSIVTACSDREGEIDAPAGQKGDKIEMNRAETARFLDDSLIKKDSLNGTHSKEGDVNATAQETIDPTKPDRPK
ncbi:hypothetical protein HX13_14770 [Chryseobacterium sp. P1-3]|uniref:Lipoprotein n=1 Tax=Chryseobacterium gallinarum TaxID=1324352 RepID=A0A0G3M0Q0_CHRGL|nr:MULTISPECIES: hypothetical protein [Chryseobacterium]AKK72751.1 hypothetical protein OK18_09050 [Chryseobacterium gallinarum]KFF74143.1 hypothetical protein HX13_14770 [Chryseobacterium sp. P1-3]QIY91511.1 hypothetical protein FOB44_13020 [Chryseobacterium gallinarum]